MTRREQAERMVAAARAAARALESVAGDSHMRVSLGAALDTELVHELAGVLGVQVHVFVAARPDDEPVAIESLDGVYEGAVTIDAQGSRRVRPGDPITTGIRSHCEHDVDLSGEVCQ